MESLVSSRTKVIEISTGMNHCAAIDSNGILYMWGSDEYGQLGMGDDSQLISTTPRVAHVSDETLMKVSCGDNFTLTLDHKGQVHSTGTNDSG